MLMPVHSDLEWMNSIRSIPNKNEGMVVQDYFIT